MIKDNTISYDMNEYTILYNMTKDKTIWYDMIEYNNL